MERQFYFNWSVIVEEAKQRRKSQKITQERLAILAGVSTPTVSRFEQGKRDIQLSSVLKILKQIGMVDECDLIFSELDYREDKARDVIFFIGYDNKKRILCAISREALIDHYGKGVQSLVEIFVQNKSNIEHEARRKYIAGNLESDGSVLIKSNDLR